MFHALTLVSHALCPCVQRIAIALAEKGVAHDRVTVDLANKPDWFLALSPLGRTPVLRVGGAALYESAAILEFLEDTQPNPLHLADSVERARHGALIGFDSECLNDIAGFYGAPDPGALRTKAAALRARLRVMEGQLGPGPWFAGESFSLVDAVFAPVFRHFDTFDRIDDFGVFDGVAKVPAWRRALAARPSVREAVAGNYDERLTDFLHARGQRAGAADAPREDRTQALGMTGTVPALRFARLTEVPLEELVAHMSDPRLRTHMPLLTGTWGEAEARGLVAAKEACWARDGLGHWAFLADGRYVGWGGFQKEGGEWDFGLVLRPQDFGLGGRITRAALEVARRDCRIPFVTFLLPPSRRNLGALRRMGARAVGCLDRAGATFLKYRLDTPPPDPERSGVQYGDNACPRPTTCP